MKCGVYEKRSQKRELLLICTIAVWLYEFPVELKRNNLSYELCQHTSWKHQNYISIGLSYCYFQKLDQRYQSSNICQNLLFGMICKSSRLATGCAHAAKLLEYWENRQILENLEPSNTFKVKVIFGKRRQIENVIYVQKLLFRRFFKIASNVYTLTHGRLILLLF